MSDKEEPLILRTQDARGVVTLTLNRPQAFNALSEAMLAQLQHALGAIATDESARVVVISAEGKAFCAGHDLKEMRADPSLDYYERLFTQCSDLMLSIQHLPVPVIGRDVRSRGRVERSPVRRERSKRRSVLLHTGCGTLTKYLAQAGVRNARDR